MEGSEAHKAGAKAYDAVRERRKKETEETLRHAVHSLQVNHDLTGEQVRTIVDDAILWEDRGA